MLDIVIAAIAGFVSFISPCVLPLVPAYIGYMGGRVTNTVSAQLSVSGGGAAQVESPSLSMRFSTFIHGLAFVAGFTFVFVTLGILGTAFVRQIGSTATVEGLIGRIGGIFIVFFGLHFMGVLPKFFNWLRQNPALLSNVLTSILVALVGYVLISYGFTGTIALWDTAAYPGWTGAVALVLIAGMVVGLFIGGAFATPGDFWNKALNTIDMALYADTRRHLSADSNKGLSGSALMGVVFAAGWTPCIGPTLGLAMTMAANGGDIGQATALMTAYSLGLGIPFLITALMLDSAQGGLRRLKTHIGTIKFVSGAFLVFIGFTIASGSLQDLSQDFSNDFGDFSIRVEECVVGVFEDDIALGQAGACLSGERDFYDLRAEHTGLNIDGTPVDADAAEDTSAAVPDDAGSDILTMDNAASLDEVLENAGPPVGLAIGQRAPNFQTQTVSGETVSLADYRGQVVLLNFWFTDCAPCRIEMPEFQSVYEEYAGELAVVAVNREESAEDILEFAEPLGLTFPLLLDEEGDIQFEYDVRGYPSTFILDRDGVIQFRSFSALTEAQIHDLIDAQMS